MGRATYGVIGVRLSGEKDDRLVAMAPVSARFPTLLSITTTGYGKRSPTDDYRETKRGAKGVRTIRTGGRNGGVVAVLPTTDASEILVTTQGGVTIRIATKGIRVQSRNTLGVRVIRLGEGDTVRDAVVLEPAAEPGPDAPPPATEPAGRGANEGPGTKRESAEPPDEDAEPEDEEDDAASTPG
jgi:DNA gyrase subunit A